MTARAVSTGRDRDDGRGIFPVSPCGSTKRQSSVQPVRLRTIRKSMSLEKQEISYEYSICRNHSRTEKKRSAGDKHELGQHLTPRSAGARRAGSVALRAAGRRY